MLVRIANMEDLDLKKQSDLGLYCFSRAFLQATNVQNFRTSTIVVALSKDWSGPYHLSTLNVSMTRRTILSYPHNLFQEYIENLT